MSNDLKIHCLELIYQHGPMDAKVAVERAAVLMAFLEGTPAPEVKDEAPTPAPAPVATPAPAAPPAAPAPAVPAVPAAPAPENPAPAAPAPTGTTAVISAQELNDGLYDLYLNKFKEDRAPIDKVMREQFKVQSINELQPEQRAQLLDAVKALPGA